MPNRSHNRQRAGLLITLLAAISFGIWPSAMRAVYADGGNASFAAIITTFARLMPMLITCLLQRRRLFPNRRDTRMAVTGGFYQALSSALLMAAAFYLPGPIVIIILFTHTLMLLLYMIARKEIQPDRLTIVTTLAALAGLSLVIDLMGQHSAGNLTGMACAFIAAIAVASRLYVIGHQTKTKNPAVVGAENFLIALLLIPLVALFQTPHAPEHAAGWGWLALGCGGLALATFGQFYAISILGPFRFSLFLKLEPLFATIFGALLVGDYLKPLQYMGIVIVIGSLMLYQLLDHRRRKTQLV